MRRKLITAILISIVVGGAFVALFGGVRFFWGASTGPWTLHLIEFISVFFATFILLYVISYKGILFGKALEHREHQLHLAQKEIEKHINEKRQTEQELVQAQKLEALGRLAGGIAHDVNNVLASIMTIASSIKLDYEAQQMQHHEDDVNDILESCRRGRDLTLSLLGFARKGDFFKRPISLVKEIRDVKKLLERVSPKTLSIKVICEANVPQIEGDPSEIKNVLMNLCINGIDAMNGVGTLTVSLDELEMEVSMYTLPAGKYVLLQVSDTGEGMTEETLKRAFEPFFTTKPEGKGTGLGLPRVWGIVKEHSGTVKIESNQGKGSTFKLLFPALDEVREDPGIKGSSPPVFGGQNTVLLVDDEVLIRKSAKRILERIGYNVILAENGKEALSIFKQQGKHIDLVLLDMIMPIMDGSETFYAIRKIRMDIPIIVCSGYSKDDSATELMKEQRVGFVQKPFSVGEISARMAQILK